MVQNAIAYMDKNLQRMNSLQEKVASGKQFQNASDNPQAAAAALTLRSSLQASQAYLDTVQVTESWLAINDHSLRQMSELGTRAIQLALQGLPDTLGANERAGIAAEIDEMIDQAVDVANTEHLGSYIYAGFSTTTKPFERDDSGATTIVTYLPADSSPIQRAIGPGQWVTVNVDGDAAFTPLFQALVAARDALNGDNPAALLAAADSLQSATDGIGIVLTANGSRQRQVKTTGAQLEKTHIEIKSLLSQKEDANLAEAISSLRYQETVYQTVLEVGNRAVAAMSLFDYLN
jgi:flagellar hook-associated protein 3 FlgL